LLRESGMTSALINGGTSTVHALGRPPESASWKVALELPKEGDLDAPRQHLAAVELHDESISVSAVWGKSFFEGGTELGHVLDPRSGRPAGRAALAAVAGPSAADTDALSTALLVLGEGELARITGLRAGLRGWVVVRAEQGYALKSSPPLDPR